MLHRKFKSTFPKSSSFTPAAIFTNLCPCFVHCWSAKLYISPSETAKEFQNICFSLQYCSVQKPNWDHWKFAISQSCNLKENKHMTQSCILAIFSMAVCCWHHFNNGALSTRDQTSGTPQTQLDTYWPSWKEFHAIL